jgi:hypothetical protein
MLRLLFISLVAIVAVFLLLQGRLNKRSDELPVFLRTDSIADAHETKIDIQVHSIYQPDSFQMAMLKKDYSGIWAHLNCLYHTNNIEAGKEYYTEDFFKQINHHYSGNVQSVITRTDVQHSLHIENWAWDGLVCTVTDSIQFSCKYADNTRRNTMANVAVVLLYQGDHWRIDAIRHNYQATIK